MRQLRLEEILAIIGTGGVAKGSRQESAKLYAVVRVHSPPPQ